MKKINILLLLVGLLFIAGCSSNEIRLVVEQEKVVEKQIESYILLDENIPQGYKLAPISEDMISMTSFLKSNPGKVKKEFFQLEKNFEIENTNYSFVVYINEENNNEVTLLIVEPTGSNSFGNEASKPFTTLLKTKEGYLILIEGRIVEREEFSSKFQSLFDGINKVNTLPEGSFLSNIVDFSNPFVGIPHASFFNESELTLMFRYDGAISQTLFFSNQTNIISNNGICNPINIKNVDINVDGNNIQFLNGHRGIILFSCDEKIKSQKYIDSSFKIGHKNQRIQETFLTEVRVRFAWD